MDNPIFIDTDAAAITSQLTADYEQMTGRTLYPGQVEQLIINAFAYRELLLRTQIQEAATMNLVAFSSAPFLDYLGQLVGVRRLTASAAVCTLQLTLNIPHNALTIPAGIRVQSQDGQATFATDSDITVIANATTATVTATCLSVGESGNDYAVGDISLILDPQPYLLAASNSEVTIGGADDETDDELRNRIMLAPESFSNAGSEGAYRFFAMSANAGIVYVSVTSPTPGQVNLYPLMENGELPNQAVLDEVYAACNSEKIRPLTDTVVVAAPTEIQYSINVVLTLITGTVASDKISEITAALQDYADSRKTKCGLDVVIDQIIQKSMVDNVYNVAVSSPSADQVVNDDEVAICQSITVTVGGYSDE